MPRTTHILKKIMGVTLCLVSIPLLILYAVAFVRTLNIGYIGAAIIPGLLAYWGYGLIESKNTETEMAPTNKNGDI